ncbi:MAG TPA: cation diffusion facilitator family transporter [Verrucomicrobiae bacterium]|nr:cation diffusion facilitator family transporter [Verrucomicrobiae bacterium]
MSDEGNIEKSSAALNSVGAAVFLTTLKIVVGLLSGSLGILAEAAHSALDFAAALITFFAVQVASKPADPGHAYGHGKVENLSALVETLLLLGTCGWIIYQSVTRLATGHVEVIASPWAFGVMLISIVVDVTRSKMLYRIAAKHRSQALEADALHFSSDVWSSVVVLVGLGGVKVGQSVRGLEFLKNADALAGLFVAAIVVWVSLKLGVRAVQALLDASPEGVADRIKSRVESVPMVFDCHAIRVRHSGPHYFVDLHITLDGNLSLRTAHELTEQVEHAVKEVLPEADVTVHPEPTPATGKPRAQSAPNPGATTSLPGESGNRSK